MATEIRSTGGRLLDSNYTVSFTPEVLLWLNSDTGKKVHRKIFFKKVENMLSDIAEFGRPKRGHAKTITTVETPVYTIRLENNQGIRILFDYSTHEGFIDLWILAVSEKKEFQDKLKRSAEHIVHASAFDRLSWENEDTEMIDLSTCTNQELEQLRKNAKLRFGNLTAKEQSDGWTQEDFENRKRRATIYDFVIPNIVDYSILKQSDDFNLPPILKLQDHQKELMKYSNNQFLLEGVAGTGKTTILLYRFVNDVKNLPGTIEASLDKILFVTHNERLKKDIISSLKLFFPPDEFVIVSKRVKTTRELFFEILGITEEPNSNRASKDKFFPPETELTRDRFRRMFDKNDIDIDLFWEEYRGILRGYNLRGETPIISKKEYNDIGRRRGRIKPFQRNAFYHLAKERRTLAKAGNSLFDFSTSWDSLSLCREVFAELDRDSNLQKIECMYVDEVQDLTKAEMEVLLLLLNPDGLNRFAVAGDLSQSIQPSSFTWQALSDLIYTILSIRVDKHETLLENFRSTPYLVQAANRILELQDELDHDATPELQRPFAGENTGEPGHIFFDHEDDLIEALLKQNLPNAACPLLVRDNETKSKLRLRLNNNSNVITIAQFKGLERRNILLWEPDSGSERVLNLRHDPIRGEFARKREYSDSTALLELRHVFVAFTRARYMMGILAPQNNDSYFMKHLLTLENSGLQDSELEKLQLFEEKLSAEALLDYAREYEDAGMFEQAAEAYRNIGDEHKYDHCKGKAAVDDQSYDEAIHHLYRATKVTIGEESENAGVLISEISTLALDSSDVKKRPETIAKILMGAVGLSETAIHRLKAEQDEERGNWNSAARNYIQAGDPARAAFCIRKIEMFNVQTILYIECKNMDLAKEAFKKYAERNMSRENSVAIALGDKERIRNVFVGPLEPLRNSFVAPDMGWAKKLASGNARLLDYVRKHGQKQILERINSSENQEREVLQLLTKTSDVDELYLRVKGKKWKFIPNEARIQLNVMKKNYSRALEEIFGLEDSYLQERLLKSIGKKVNRRNEIEGLYEILSTKPVKVPISISPVNEFFAKLIAIGFVSEATKIDSREFQKMRNRMYGHIGTNKNLSQFCTQWSVVLMNFQIRNGTKEITSRDKFELEVLLNQHETNNNIAMELVFMYALHGDLHSPRMDKHLNVLWKRLSSRDREAIQMNILLGSPESVVNLPNFLQINDRTEHLVSVFKMSHPDARNIEKQLKRDAKQTKKSFKHYTNELIRYNHSKLRGVFKNSLRSILSLPQITYLTTGKHQKGIENEPESLPKQMKIPENETAHDHVEIELDKNNAVNEEEVATKNDDSTPMDSGIKEEILLSDFATGDANSHDSKFTSEAWSKLVTSEPNEHIRVAKELIDYKQFENHIQKRVHLLECVDESLTTTEKEVEPHHKFVVILVVVELAKEIEENSELIDVLPKSTIESIRLFKEQHKKTILASKAPYSFRVLN